MKRRPPDSHFADPDLARIYDVTCGWSKDRDFYLALADRPGMDILDLGCGTGLLCDAYARAGHRVVGADPAAAMLAEGRGKPHGAHIQWVEAHAQDFASERRFDLIIMTGHAFQTLLEETDVIAVLEVVAGHLKPEGRFVFESRNPGPNWAAKWDGRQESWTAGAETFHQSTRVLKATADTISFEHAFRFEDRTLHSRSTLRFFSKSTIESLLSRAGLACTAVYGDWTAAPFDPTVSREMIFTAAHATAS